MQDPFARSALAAGYSPQEIEEYQNRRKLATIAQPQQPQGNQMLSMLPSLAATAASFIPGVGSLAAGAIGGAGELGRQALSGEKLDLGKAGGEALLSAVPFGAGKIAKGVGLLGKGAKAASKTEGVAGKLAPTPGEVSFTKKTGQDIRAINRGTQVGAKVPENPHELLDRETEAAVNDVISRSNKGFIPDSDRGQLENVQIALKAQGKRIGDISKNSKVILGDEQFSRLEQLRDHHIGKISDLMPEDLKTVNHYWDRVTKSRKLGQFEDERRNLDDVARGLLKNPDATGTMKAKIARAFRDAMDDLVSGTNRLDPSMPLAELAPGLKAAKTEYRNLRLAEDMLGRTVNSGGGYSFGFAPKVLTNNVIAPIMQRGLEGAGKALETVGSNSIPMTAARRLGAQELVRAPFGETQPAQPDFSSPEAALGQPMQSQLPATPDQALQPQTSPSGFTDEQLMQAISIAIMSGDTKAAAQGQQLLELNKMAQPSDQLSLSDTAIGNITDTQSGINQLSALGEDMSANPQNSPLLGAVRQFNPFDTDFQSQQADIDRVRQIVGKAMEGGVLRKEDEEKYKKILPTMQDTPEVAQAKISKVMAQLKAKLGDYMQYQTSVGKGAGQFPEPQQLSFGQ